jgi:hypothetical protein
MRICTSVVNHFTLSIILWLFVRLFGALKFE